MYYAVKLGKKTYYSKEIVKHVKKLGDAGILRDTNNGKITSVQILSVNLYELDKKEVADLDFEAMGIQVQDLNATVKTFSSVTDDREVKLITSAKGSVTWSMPELGDIQFVELRSILYARKYQMQDSLPILDVCGTRYVAVNATKKGFDTYISY